MGAIALYVMIQVATNLILGGITGYFPPNPVGEVAAQASLHPDFLLIPLSAAVGGLLAGVIIFKFAPEAEGHGTDEAIAAFHRGDGKIRHRIPLVKAIASAFTIGSGGSGGREGPTAQIAAGFGSFVGDVFRLPVHEKRIAVAVGIGAGIGSIFKSPFAGAILSAEILYSGGDFEAEALLPAFIASPLGYVIFASYAGFSPIFGSSLVYTFTDPRNLILYALLGAACGLVARLFTATFYATKRLFASLGLPRYVKPMIGAALSGVVAIFFPEVIGLGYGFLQFLIEGDMSRLTVNYFALPILVTLVLLVLLKILATSLTVGSGGSAGVFAPSLVIGGFTGAAVWVVFNAALPGWGLETAPFVVVGMMALFGGVGRVPIAVILMVSEMTGSLSLLAPAMVAVVVSYFVTGSANTIYRSQVLRRSESPAHIGEYSTPLMTKLFVVDAMNPNVVAMAGSDQVSKAYKAMLDGGFRGLPVVEEGKVVGVVTMSDLLRVPREKMDDTRLSEVMTRDPVVAYPDDSLLSVLNRMANDGIGRLPVVGKENAELVGIITMTDVMRAYDRALQLLKQQTD